VEEGALRFYKQIPLPPSPYMFWQRSKTYKLAKARHFGQHKTASLTFESLREGKWIRVEKERVEINAAGYWWGISSHRIRL